MIGRTFSHYASSRSWAAAGWCRLQGRGHPPRPFRGPQVPAGGPRREPQALERFQREARAASALSHSGICTVYDVDAHEGQWFIAMELLEGQTLRERIGGGRSSFGPARSRSPDDRRSRRRAWQRRGAPRLEARERVGHAAGPGEDPGLRPRQAEPPGCRVGLVAEADGSPARADRRGARWWGRSPTCPPAGAGRAARRADGSLQRGDRALRDGDGGARPSRGRRPESCSTGS